MYKEIPNKYKEKYQNFKIIKKDLKDGINNYEEFLIYKENDQFKIYDRKCDHAGGKLISTNKGKIVCPMHKWEFDPATNLYSNNVKKTTLNFINGTDYLEFNILQ